MKNVADIFINSNDIVTCQTIEKHNALYGYTNVNKILLVSIATIVLGIIIYLVIRKNKKNK